MKKLTKKTKETLLTYGDEKYLKLEKVILEDSLTPIKILKDDQRSKVILFEYMGEKLVLKEPKEKNRRRWQKFISIFRGSYSDLEYRNAEKVMDLGFKGSVPILSLTTYKNKFVDRSYFVSTYLKGEEGTFKYLNEISDELKKIHKTKRFHGDSQLVNFIVSEDNEIYLIDAKLNKNRYGLIGERYEFIFMEASTSVEVNNYPKDDIYYKLAKAFYDYIRWVSRTRRRLKGKKD